MTEEMMLVFMEGIVFGFGLTLLIGLISWGISVVCRLFIKMVRGGR